VRVPGELKRRGQFHAGQRFAGCLGVKQFAYCPGVGRRGVRRHCPCRRGRRADRFGGDRPGKHVKIKSTALIGSGMAQACHITAITGSIGNPGNATLAAVPTTYDGGPAYEVPVGPSGAIFVSRGATPLLLKVDYQGNDGRVATFSGYNAGTITVPPAAETLDGSKYGL